MVPRLGLLLAYSTRCNYNTASIRMIVCKPLIIILFGVFLYALTNLIYVNKYRLFIISTLITRRQSGLADYLESTNNFEIKFVNLARMFC